MSSPVVILGAGPAGLGAAYQLAKRKLAGVKVIEQADNVGGNSGSFQIDGIWADYGSHRFHAACEPRIIEDLRQLLGADLLLRPRHGRIRLRDRWVHFPLKPGDLALHLPLGFAAGAAADLIAKPFRKASREAPSFASVLERSLGDTMSREFYFPYACKIWGADPADLSPIQAQRRVSANSPSKLLRKVFRRDGNQFYYPRKGFGQITARLKQAAESAGAEFLLNTRVTRIERTSARVEAVWCHSEGTETRLEARHVWSTLPLTLLVHSIDPPAPPSVTEAAAGIQFRAMILIYLVLEKDRFTEYDAHYFPEESIPITRLSEPKNYSGAREPEGLTALCAELPCDTASAYWHMSDSELGAIVSESLRAAGLKLDAPLRRVLTRRLSHAYPLYRIGYEKHFETIDAWIDEFENLLTFGRQGLFAHDNTHHALSMAYSAADCLDATGNFDWDRWRVCRRVFETHVVED